MIGWEMITSYEFTKEADINREAIIAGARQHRWVANGYCSR
jgi:hypothetical protein